MNRYNEDVQNMYGKPNILSYCRNKMIEWAERVRRAEGKTLKRVRNVDKRPVGGSEQDGRTW